MTPSGTRPAAVIGEASGTARLDPRHVLVEDNVPRYVRAHGGTVYVWGDRSGFRRVATGPPPDQAVTWESVEAEGITFSVESSLAAGYHWRVFLRRFPRRRVDAEP